MTGDTPVALDDRELEPAGAAPRWSPSRKVASRHLEAYLARTAAETYVEPSAHRNPTSTATSG
jgi:hypothetical protein